MDLNKFSYSANLAAELAALELQVADKKSQLLRSLGVDLATTMSESTKDTVDLLANELGNAASDDEFEDLTAFVASNKEAIASSLASEIWYSSAEYAEQAEQYDEAVFGDGYSE